MDIDTLQAQDQFAKTIGIEFLRAEPGFAKAQLPSQEMHKNGVGLIHGGAIFSLAAATFFAAANAMGNIAVGVNLSINYLNPVECGTLTAEAVEISRSRKLSTCDVRVTTEDGTLVATFRGTAYIKGASSTKPS